jgi:uncharacterized protein YdeI (YjbR/CyaY-like superfamily)
MALAAEPLPTDTVPPELAAALAASREASEAWERLAPSHRRRYVGSVLGAKKPETRRRRVDGVVEQIIEGARSER